MRYKIILLLIISFSTFLSVGQVISTFSFIQKKCVGSISDTLKYSCSNDTLYITLRQPSGSCSIFSTTIQIIGDTLKITAIDISPNQCWDVCTTILNYKIWGLIPKFYIGKHIGLNYPIYCWSTGIQSQKQFPPFLIKADRLVIDFNKPAQFRLFDVSGRLLISTTENEINLKQFNFNSGVYFIIIDSESYSGRQKIFIEE